MDQLDLVIVFGVLFTLMMVSGILNMVMGVKYPKLEKERDALAKENELLRQMVAMKQSVGG